jgi:hypothetical protein
MNKKIPFQNRIFAFLLSILFAVCLFASFFALPVELKMFNPASYSAMVQRVNMPRYSRASFRRLWSIRRLRPIQPQINLIANKDTISSIIAGQIPTDLVQSTFKSVIDQMFLFMNFKIPMTDLKINVSDLKTSLASSSPEIAKEFLATLPNCQEGELTGLDLNSNLTVKDLPFCKPSGAALTQYGQIWGMAFEDLFNELPSSISLADVISPGQNIPDRYFNSYSLVRWGIRLLPILTIIIMILIALLLRNQREVMRKWCGRLLVGVSGITLLALVILMIGFDQFIVMILNPFLKNTISGFGSVMVGTVQDVGFQMLIWVIVSALIVMGFGLILILTGKFFKPAVAEAAVETAEVPAENTAEVPSEAVAETTPEVLPAEEPTAEESPAGKTVLPETMEEVEEAEKKRKKSRKKTDQE